MGDKKNMILSPAFKRMLFFFLMLFPMLTYAQDDTPEIDSIIRILEEASDEGRQSPDVSIEEQKNRYFLKKWELTADSFVLQQRNVPDSLVKKMQQDDAFWYANADLKEKPEQKKSNYIPLGQRQWFQTLLWLVIIGGFAAFIMWYLASSNVGLFRNKNKDIQMADDSELITEDIFAINYQKEIDKAEANRNYRLAIRLMFLRLLKDMAEKDIIQYKQDRTNLDYLLQLHPTGYYNNFFRITRNYEYSWYGKFDVGEEAYRIIRNDFNQLDRQLT